MAICPSDSAIRPLNNRARLNRTLSNINHALRNSIPLPVVLCDSSEYGSAYIVLLGNSEVLRCCNEMPWKERLPQEESRTYYSGRC